MAVDRTGGGIHNKRSGETESRSEHQQAYESGVRSRRRSGGRGQVSGKRRRNGQPVDDIRIRIRKASLEMKLLMMKSFVGDEDKLANNA